MPDRPVIANTTPHRFLTFFSLTLILSFALVACRQSDTTIVQLNEPFTIQVGQSAILENDALMITFVSVLEDIRCPSQVECSEKGFARISIVVQQAEQNPSTYEMNTEPYFSADVGLGLNKITYLDYEVQLTALTPYPEYPDDELNFDVYEATFVVSKTSAQSLPEPTPVALFYPNL
jgi:hypothetical protein